MEPSTLVPPSRDADASPSAVRAAPSLGSGAATLAPAPRRRPPAPPVAPAPRGMEATVTAGRRPAVDVSVLVPVYDEEQHLPESVAAMLAQDYEGSFELVFVDGRSADRTVEILEQLQRADDRIRILDNPDRTVSHGLNVALRAARGRYVARMDAHTTYPPGYLRRGVARLQEGDVDWVAGPQVPHGRRFWSRIVATALSGALGRGASDKWQAADADVPAREWELGTSVFSGVWRRETLDELGGWDDGWDVNEDSELAARLHARGGRIVCRTDMAARYVPRDSLRGLGRQYWRYGSFRARTFARHPSSCGPLRLAASLLPPALASALLPGPAGVPGRVLAALYALALAAQVARLRPAPSDAPALAAVLATMHLAWGAGFLRSAVRTSWQAGRLRRSAPARLERP